MVERFRIPKTTPVFHYKYRTREIKNLGKRLHKKDPEFPERAIGAVLFASDEIFVEKNLWGIEQVENYLHEIIHCIAVHLQVEAQEVEIEAMTMGLTPAIYALLKAQKSRKRKRAKNPSKK